MSFQPAPSKSQAPSDAQSDRSRSVVLYIEDDAANVRLVEHILKLAGDAELLSAAEGRRGVELARMQRPDLILLDLHLPDMTGEMVVAEIKSHPATHAIPVVVLSGAADESQPRGLLEQGASAYLAKPFSVADIIAVVERFAVRQA